jgi:hypothetical protein
MNTESLGGFKLLTDVSYLQESEQTEERDWSQTRKIVP